MDANAKPHTPEQEAILDAAASTKANLMISALAGCGKSTTLLAIERATSPLMDRKPILYLAFNLENVLKIMSLEQMETEKRKPHAGHSLDPADRCLPSTTVRTFNSLGHRIWSESRSRNLTLDPKKSGNILKSVIDVAPAEHRGAIWSVFGEVIAGVALAKALGYVPEEVYPSAKRLITKEQFHRALDEAPDDLTSDLIDAVLTRSIKMAYEGEIDYNDQVYMPALFGGTFPRFPLVLVDEYQDLSPVNHALLARLVKGRLIGVGDPYQNIYGFRGAKAGGMEEAIKAYSCTSLPLSVSFRCPSEIVKGVHWRVPHFRWLNEGGAVDHPNHFPFHDFPDDATVICRNNAPLFRVGMQLLAAGRSITLAGSDIGPRLVGIMRKLGSESLDRAGVIVEIDKWLEAKLAKESKTAEDMAACMRVFAEKGKDLRAAIAYAEHLFKQTGRLQLTTGHKAKGLEWSHVIHLDPWLVRRDAHEQNQNLDYVISTRSRDRLIEIDSEQIEW